MNKKFLASSSTNSVYLKDACCNVIEYSADHIGGERIWVVCGTKPDTHSNRDWRYFAIRCTKGPKPIARLERNGRYPGPNSEALKDWWKTKTGSSVLNSSPTTLRLSSITAEWKIIPNSGATMAAIRCRNESFQLNWPFRPRDSLRDYRKEHHCGGAYEDDN